MEFVDDLSVPVKFLIASSSRSRQVAAHVDGDASRLVRRQHLRLPRLRRSFTDVASR